MRIRHLLLPLPLLLALPAAADRYDALRGDPQIASGVLVAAIGDLIGDSCPGIGERRARSILALNALVGRAQSLGYSVGEIRAYADDKAEKARVKAQARVWMEQQGADPSDAAAVCAVARAQIAAGSPVGRLMYLK